MVIQKRAYELSTDFGNILTVVYRVSHFNLWTRISSKLRYLQKNGL